MAPPTLHRGTVFRAEHDNTYEFWGSGAPRSKYGVVFNAAPVAGESNEEVLYFLCTSKVSKLREKPAVLSDVMILPAGEYTFFPDETAIDCRSLCAVPLAKLVQHHMKIVGELTPAHIRQCEETVAKARILEFRAKKLLGLR
jgi:hypothetical protein